MTRLTDAAIHDRDMFIKPAGLAGVLERHGLKPGEMAGPGPGAWPGPAMRHVWDSPIQAAPARSRPAAPGTLEHDNGPPQASAAARGGPVQDAA